MKIRKVIIAVAICAALVFCVALATTVSRDEPEAETSGTAKAETTAATTEEQTEAETTELQTTVSVEETTAVQTEPPHIAVDGLTLDKYEVSLYVGQTDMPLVTMTPSDASNKGEAWSSNNLGVATVDSWGNITAVGVGSCTVTVRSTDNTSLFADVAVTVVENPQEPKKEEIQPTYIGDILVVNKTYALPANYNPGTNDEAYAALVEMISAASSEGISLWVISGFRSYSDQYVIYNSYVARDGEAAANRYSAKPGHSEHQTGLAFDLNSLYYSFGDTAEGQWIANNCHKYGFIVRYPQGKEAVTGYVYEPWHIRYIGKDNAAAVYASGLCLEEYLGIS